MDHSYLPLLAHVSTSFFLLTKTLFMRFIRIIYGSYDKAWWFKMFLKSNFESKYLGIHNIGPHVFAIYPVMAHKNATALDKSVLTT